MRAIVRYIASGEVRVISYDDAVQLVATGVAEFVRRPLCKPSHLRHAEQMVQYTDDDLRRMSR